MPRFAVLSCFILVVLPALQVLAKDSETSHVFGVRGVRLDRRAIPASASELQQAPQATTSLTTGSPTPDSQSGLNSEDPASGNLFGTPSPLTGSTNALTPDDSNSYTTTSTPAANVNGSMADPSTLFGDSATTTLPTSQTNAGDSAGSWGDGSTDPNSAGAGISPGPGGISRDRHAFPDASGVTSSVSKSWAKLLERALNASITALPGLEKFAPQIQALIGEQVDDTLEASSPADPNVQEPGHSAGKNASLALGGKGSINVTNKVSGEGEMQGHYANGTACEADAYITLSATSLTTLSGLFVATRELEEVVSRDGTEKHTTLVEKIKAAISFSMLSVIKIVATPQVTECQVAPSETVFTSRIQANMTVIGQMIAELKQDVNGSSSLNIKGGLGVKSGVKAEANLTHTVGKTLRRCTPEERLMKLGASASAKLLDGLGIENFTQNPTTSSSNTQLSHPDNQSSYPTDQNSQSTDQNSYPTDETTNPLSQTTYPTTEASNSVPSQETPSSMNYFQHRRSLNQNAAQQAQANSPLDATSNSADPTSALSGFSDPSTGYAPQDTSSSSPVESNSTTKPAGDVADSSGLYPSQSQDSPTMTSQTPDLECSLDDDDTSSYPDEESQHTENHVPNKKEALNHVEKCYNATIPTVTGVCSSIPKEGPSGVHLGDSPEKRIKVNVASYVQTGSTVIYNFINQVNGGSGARTDDDDDTTPCEKCNHHGGLWRGNYPSGGGYPGSGGYPGGEADDGAGYPGGKADKSGDYPGGKSGEYPGGKEGPTGGYPGGKEGSSGGYPGGKEGPTSDYPGGKEGETGDYPGGKEGSDYPSGNEGPSADYPGGKTPDGGAGEDGNYPGGKSEEGADYPGGGSQMLDVTPPTGDKITSPNGSPDEGTPKLGGGSSEQEKCVCGPDRKTHLRIRSLEDQLASVHRMMRKRGLNEL